MFGAWEAKIIPLNETQRKKWEKKRRNRRENGKKRRRLRKRFQKRKKEGLRTATLP